MGIATIALDRASLIALILETLNYGIFTVLFVITVWVILNRRQGSPNRALLVTLCLIWILSTVHWIIDICRAVTAFLNTPEGALAYYSDVSKQLQVAKTAVYVTLTLTGDSFVIYRCYVVWSRKWFIIILPIMLWIATGVVGYITTHAFLETKKGGIFLMNLIPWVTSFICMTLSTNVVCTALIAYRILRSQMAIRRFQRNGQNSRVYSAFIILLESACIYSSALVALVTVYLLNSNGQFIILDITAQLIGIAFSMIILRVALGISSSGSHASASAESGVYRMGRRGLAVNVSHLVEVDNDTQTHSSSPGPKDEIDRKARLAGDVESR